MKGSDLIAGLPPKAGIDRDIAVLTLALQGHYAPIRWKTIWTTFGDYVGAVSVSADVFRIGDESDSIRMAMGHRGAQLLADVLDLYLLTPKLSDLTWAFADIRLFPMVMGTEKMATTERMVQHHAKVEQQLYLTGGQPGDLVADVGKDWVITALLADPPEPLHSHWCVTGPMRSSNYGWHCVSQKACPGALVKPARTADGRFVIQPVGYCHGIDYSDYSQFVRLVYREMLVCGPGLGLPTFAFAQYDPNVSGCAIMDVDSVVRDPKLYGLVSTHVIPTGMRHPKVPKTIGGPKAPGVPVPSLPEEPPPELPKPPLLVASTLPTQYLETQPPFPLPKKPPPVVPEPEPARAVVSAGTWAWTIGTFAASAIISRRLVTYFTGGG